jgi:dTDP-4-amino-4,6-dideoxygalactose transaminase
VRDSLGSLLQSRFSCERVVLTGSGTQALELAIRCSAASNPARGHVVVPAYSCFDVASAAVGAGVRIRLYDLDPGTLAPDMESLAEAVGTGAAAVLVANLYGFPVDWDEVREICRTAGALLIEDAAQGLGSRWKGSEGGTFGDFTVLSFGRGKGWTGGEGGGLLARVPGVGAEEALSEHGWPRALALWLRTGLVTAGQWVLGRPSLFGLPSALPWLGLGETRYKDPLPPRSISSLAASLVAVTSLDALEESRRRMKLAEKLSNELTSLSAASGLSLIQPVAGGKASFLRFPILSESGSPVHQNWTRFKRLGGARGYPRPLFELPALAERLEGFSGEFPGAVELSKKLVTLPTHSLVSESDLAAMIRLLSDVSRIEGT